MLDDEFELNFENFLPKFDDLSLEVVIPVITIFICYKGTATFHQSLFNRTLQLRVTYDGSIDQL